MLRKGEEIIVLFVPLLMFLIVWTYIFQVFKIDAVFYGLKEWLLVSLIYFAVYYIGFLVLLKKVHKSYLIPYLFGFLFWIYISLTREIPGSLGSIQYKYLFLLLDALVIFSYSRIRIIFFEMFGFSEEEYNRRHNFE